jgi:hypothetical protein
MQIKIKANDIELEYTDEYSLIEEDSKRRLIEIIQEMRKLPTVSAFDAFPDSGTEPLFEYEKVNDPMWFVKQQPLNEDIKLGYSQAVYQIRLKLSSMVKEPPEIRKYTMFMIEELNKKSLEL